MDPLWLKLAHVLGATLLFGVGLGSAFHMWRAHKSDDARVVATVTRSVVLVDAIFIAPAAVLQPLTGLLLAHVRGWPLSTAWIV